MGVGLLKTIGGFILKRSPGILTGAGIAGMVVAGVMAVKATPKANLAVDRATTDKGSDLTTLEKAKVYAKEYWKPVTVGFVSGAAIVGGAVAGAKKRAALEAALALTTSALSSQSDKIIEKYGKDAFDAIRGSVAKDRIEAKHPLEEHHEGTLPADPTNEAIAASETVYHDAWTGYEFVTTPTRLIDGVSAANRQLRHQEELTLNEFFDNIPIKGYGDEVTTRRYGDLYGWSFWKGPVDLEYKVIDSEQRNGKTYLIMGFNVQPLDKIGS